MSDDGRVGKLLRGEKAAVDAYEDALGHTEAAAPAGRVLRVLLEEHRSSLAALEEAAGQPGRAAEEGAGVWGAFTGAVEKAASWLGDRTALKALKEGEVHGLSEYRTALDDADTPDAVRRLLRDELIPRQERHVGVLDDLIAALEAPERLDSLEDRVRRRAGD